MAEGRLMPLRLVLDKEAFRRRLEPARPDRHDLRRAALLLDRLDYRTEPAFAGRLIPTPWMPPPRRSNPRPEALRGAAEARSSRALPKRVLFGLLVRIPMKPAGDSDLKAATHSDLKAATIPI